MSRITIKVPMSIGGIKTLQKRILEIKKKAPKMQKLFIKKSLQYIKQRAVENLRDSYEESSWYIRTGTLENSWTMVSNEISGVLRNVAPYSAFVEYGTGLVGKHPLSNLHGYQYNVNGHDGGWLFKADGYEGFHYTEGLPGYWFIYRAVFDDYINSNKPQQFFDEAFKEVMGNE